MKYLRYALMIIAVIIIGFFLLGIFKKSISYGHEITVHKTVEEAWAVHQDASKYHEWLKGFKSIELLTGEEGAVGSTYKVVVNPAEGEPDFEMIETLKSIDKFEQVDLTFDSEMMRFDQTTYFSEDNDYTTIRTDSRVYGKGIIMRSIFAMMEMFAHSFDIQETKNLEALKVVIEQNTTDYYPDNSQVVIPVDSLQ